MVKEPEVMREPEKPSSRRLGHTRELSAGTQENLVGCLRGRVRMWSGEVVGFIQCVLLSVRIRAYPCVSVLSVLSVLSEGSGGVRTCRHLHSIQNRGLAFILTDVFTSRGQT